MDIWGFLCFAKISWRQCAPFFSHSLSMPPPHLRILFRLEIPRLKYANFEIHCQVFVWRIASTSLCTCWSTWVSFLYVFVKASCTLEYTWEYCAVHHCLLSASLLPCSDTYRMLTFLLRWILTCCLCVSVFFFDWFAILESVLSHILKLKLLSHDTAIFLLVPLFHVFQLWYWYAEVLCYNILSYQPPLLSFLNTGYFVLSSTFNDLIFHTYPL